MRTAFKEWAVIVDALGRGEQILILRKGGISEGRRGFHVQHPRFFLFPTLFHQQREAVIPAAQDHFDEMVPRLSPNEVTIQFFASVVTWQRIDSLAAAERLKGQHIWRDETVASRFEWGPEQNIHALALRVYRLACPVRSPIHPEYAGCKSWIELTEEISLEGSSPVLDEIEFDEKLRQLHGALESAPLA